MTLAVQAFRFHFRTLSPLYFGRGKMTNLFRGAIGTLLRRSVCNSDCPGAGSCGRRFECPYARLFEPHQDGGPSGLADPPRPFVLRADTLEARTLNPGSSFWLDVHLFDFPLRVLSNLVTVFRQLAVDGLGPHRSRVELLSVATIPDGAVATDSYCFTVPLAATTEVTAMSLDFLTPLELKHNRQLLQEPDFGVIFSRARDRISTICTLYQGNTPAFDFLRLGEQARQVRLVHSELTRMSWERTSSRTGLTNELRGFTGRASYEGPLSELLPVIQAAYWTGIGRQTVWGLGAVRVDWPGS